MARWRRFTTRFTSNADRMYVLSTGCQWRYIPKDLPPRSTVNGYFCLWGYNGALEKIHHALYVKCRSDVCPEHRVPVALHPKRPATAEHGERLLLLMGLQWRVGEDSPRALRQMQIGCMS